MMGIRIQLVKRLKRFDSWWQLIVLTNQAQESGRRAIAKIIVVIKCQNALVIPNSGHIKTLMLPQGFISQE
jgi:hypothetical protein